MRTAKEPVGASEAKPKKKLADSLGAVGLEKLRRSRMKSATRIILLCPLALVLMGNQECQDPQSQRELRRRVQMGAVNAPQMPLPDGGTFDFKFAAASQMYTALKKTQSFSTSTINGMQDFDLEKMDEADRAAFNQCEDTGAQFQSQDLYSKVLTQNSACMIGMPQAVIKTNIVNFELTQSGGLSVGIADFANLGVGLNFKKATLTMSMDALDPLIPGHVIASSSPKAKRQEFAINLSMAPGGIGIGADFYTKTDLAKVVSTAMEKGLDDLKGQFNKAEAWYAQVLRNCDKAILINAGNSSDAGLQVGDQLEVYNVWYDWEGESCNSTLLGSMKATQYPIAVVQVEIVGNTFSQAKVIEQTEVKILPGARVYVRKLNQPVPKTVKANSSKLASR